MSLSHRNTLRILHPLVLLLILSVLYHLKSRECCHLPPLTSAQTPQVQRPSGGLFQEIDRNTSIKQGTIARLRNEGIVVIFKTGARDIDKLAFHLATTLRDFEASDVVIFSDMEGTIGPFIIHDIIKHVDPDIRDNNTQFDVYREIQKLKAQGRSLSNMDSSQGWNLDKFKFLHMTEQALAMRPDGKWFFFMESDTYVIWSNLLAWLERLDPTKEHYLGAHVQGSADFFFAYGGAGFVLSAAAIKKVVGPKGGFGASWDQRMVEQYCGDCALTRAINDAGIPLKDNSKILHKDALAEIPSGPGKKGSWCEPIVSMHHMTSSVVNDVWQFERKMEDLDRPLTWSDFHAQFFETRLDSSDSILEDWDNRAEDLVFKPIPTPEELKASGEKVPKLHGAEKEAHKSAEKCLEACIEKKDCYQWQHHRQSCKMQIGTWRLGWYREGDGEGRKYRSGWMKERIREWAQKHKCEVDWSWTTGGGWD